MKKYALGDVDPALVAKAETLCKNYFSASVRLTEAKEKLAVYDSKIINTESSLRKAVFLRKKEELIREIAPDQETVNSFDRLYGSLVGRQKLVIEQLYIRKISWDELEDAFGQPITRGSAAWERKKALYVMAQELGEYRGKQNKGME